MIDIYLIHNKVNGKNYVGKTQRGYLKRFEEHCSAYKHGCRNYISCAIHKYGRENFDVELIVRVEDDTWEYWEQYYIKYYHSHFSENGYNVTYGGDSNPMDIPEVALKHRELMGSESMKSKTRKPFDEWNYGNSEKRKKFNKEISERQKGIYVNQFKKHNETRKVRVGIVENDIIIKEFKSASEACAYLNKPTKEAGNILKVCDSYNKNGTRKTMFGYSWSKL